MPHPTQSHHPSSLNEKPSTEELLHPHPLDLWISAMDLKLQALIFAFFSVIVGLESMVWGAMERDGISFGAEGGCTPCEQKSPPPPPPSPPSPPPYTSPPPPPAPKSHPSKNCPPPPVPSYSSPFPPLPPLPNPPKGDLYPVGLNLSGGGDISVSGWLRLCFGVFCVVLGMLFSFSKW